MNEAMATILTADLVRLVTEKNIAEGRYENLKDAAEGFANELRKDANDVLNSMNLTTTGRLYAAYDDTIINFLRKYLGDGAIEEREAELRAEHKAKEKENE